MRWVLIADQHTDHTRIIDDFFFNHIHAHDTLTPITYSQFSRCHIIPSRLDFKIMGSSSNFSYFIVTWKTFWSIEICFSAKFLFARIIKRKFSCGWLFILPIIYETFTQDSKNPLCVEFLIANDLAVTNFYRSL